MKSVVRFFTILLIATSCKKNSYDSPLPVTVKEVQIRNDASLGNVLTDKDGRTLYYSANDAAGTNTCTGNCAILWPVFNTDNLTTDKLGTGLDIHDFGSTTTSSGNKQTSYKGRPLYYFAPASDGVNIPEPAGQTGGDNKNGVFFVAKPDYTINISNAQLTGHDGKNYLLDDTEGNGKSPYFTDGKGLTLYTFINDKFNKNNFTAPDFSNNNVWPIYETDKIVVPSSLDKTQFSSINVFGRKQLTYKGWPLYYFGQDGSVMGSNKGVSFPTPRVWYVPVALIDVANP